MLLRNSYGKLIVGREASKENDGNLLTELQKKRFLNLDEINF